MSTQPHSERSHGSSSRGGHKLQHHEREDERRTARVHPSGARSDAYGFNGLRDVYTHV
jgi:hypothetical protein